MQQEHVIIYSSEIIFSIFSFLKIIEIIIPIIIEQIIPPNDLIRTIFMLWLKARYVDVITNGLIIGTASIKVIAIPIGNLFLIKLRAIGTMAHSQIGNINPITDAIAKPNNLFLGNTFCITSSETNS